MTPNSQDNESKKDDFWGKPQKPSLNIIQKNNERFHSVFDNMLEGVQILGHDWRYLYLNAAAERHNRRSNQELLGNRYMDMWPGIEETHVFSLIKRCMEERIASQLENRFVYPNGVVGWFMLSIEPILEGVLIMSFDITERVRAEKQLAQMTRLYATLSQVNQTIVRVREREELFQTICDLAVRFGEFALAWIGLLEDKSGDVRPVAANGANVDQWPFPIININQGSYQNGVVAEALRTSGVVTSEDIQTDERPQSLRDLIQKYDFHSLAVVPFRMQGKPVGILSLVSRESGFFKADEEVHLLEEMGLDISFALDTMENEKIMRQWADAFEHCAHGMAIGIPATNRILTCNPAFARSLGRTLEETAGIPILEIYLPEDHERIRQSVAEADRTGHAQFESHMIGKDGKAFPVQMDVVSVRGENGNLLYRVATQQDITERKQADEKLQASERRLKLFVEYAPAAIAMFDRDMKYISASRRFIEDYRLADQNIIGRSHYEIFPEIPQRWKEIHRRCLAGTIEKAEEDPFPRGDGTLDWVRWEIHPWYENAEEIGGIILFSEVITEHKKAKEKIQQQIEHLTALREIDRAVAGSMDIRLVLEVALEHAMSELKVDAAVILLYDPNLQTLNYKLGMGLQTSALQYTRLRLGEGYAGRAALGRQTIFITNLQTRTTDFLRSPTFSQEGFDCYFGIPLIAKGEVQGVLEIFHRTPLNPDSEWLDFMETLAGQIAIAIDNATLYKGLQRSNVELVRAYDATIEGWAQALELRDMETEGHSRRVVDLTLELARKMGIAENQVVHIRRGALLHDIGKMGVPDAILQKPGSLTDDEWAIMRKHPVHAYKWLAPISYLRSALDIPYCHHEKWDGTGYPRGLKGEQIPLAARIFAVVDVWDALRSDRPYRASWSEERAYAYIIEQSGKHFDPQVVKVFLQTVDTDESNLSVP